ncbi:hypothetical protein ED733_002488 [Metarhizium rileyi]|uniref:Helix-turn-helix domain-containing protein n=1 Tax=Metarhizium rileyi (strain RCEF 4871) TaxID=1649241 RepID=A0A5C6G7J7_METRR|nr:hypothetical protein ED733_002488 [Metarhizium rileyi]
MGSSVSKAGRATAAVKRRYPTPNRSGQTPPNLHSTDHSTRLPRKSGKQEHATKVYGNDPDFTPSDFSQRLYDMGMVQPNATKSSSATDQNNTQEVENDPSTIHHLPTKPIKHNATLSVLEARRHLQQQADDETANSAPPGRRLKRYIDMRTLINVMRLRDMEMSPMAIEERLGLQPGTVTKLGHRGILSHVSKSM